MDGEEKKNEDPPYARNASYRDQWRVHLRQHCTPAGAAGSDSAPEYDEQDDAGPGGIVVVNDCIHVDAVADDDEADGGISSSSNAKAWVLACTSRGSVYAWTLPLPFGAAAAAAAAAAAVSRDETSVSEEDEWNDAVGGEGGATPARASSLLKPIHKWQLNPHRTALYKLLVVTGGTPTLCKRLLLAAGEGCGILAFDLDRLVIDQGAPLSSSSPPIPLLRFEPFPKPFGTVPVTDFFVGATDSSAATITAVAPDDWGLYRWKLGTGERIPVRAAGRTGAEGPLTCACPVRAPEPRAGIGSLLLGREAGVVYCVDDAALEMVEGPPVDPKPFADPGHTRIDMRALLQLPQATVTHIVEVNHCWWTVAGARTAAGVGSGAGGVGGYVATVHAPSRTVVRWVSTRETPQRLLYVPNRHFVAVLSNTPVVQLRQAVSLDVKERWWSSLRSCHAVATMTTSTASDDSDWTVVGGVAGQLDVFRASTRVFALGL
jgi:hypothetical protein